MSAGAAANAGVLSASSAIVYPGSRIVQVFGDDPGATKVGVDFQALPNRGTLGGSFAADIDAQRFRPGVSFGGKTVATAEFWQRTLYTTLPASSFGRLSSGNAVGRNFSLFYRLQLTAYDGHIFFGTIVNNTEIGASLMMDADLKPYWMIGNPSFSVTRSPTALSLGQKYTLAVRNTPAGLLSVWVNGVSAVSISRPGGSNVPGTRTSIGLSSFTFRHLLGMIEIWDTDFTDAQMASKSAEMAVLYP